VFLKARGFVAVSLALVPAFIGTMAWVSRRDVLRETQRIGGPSAGLTFDGIRISGTHGLSVSFETHKVPELNRAYWRLVPFRKVEFVK